MITSTAAASPTTFETTSPRIDVVATTRTRSDETASDPVVAAPQAPSTRTQQAKTDLRGILRTCI